MQVVAAAALTVAVTYWGMARHRAQHVVAGLVAVVILAAVISGAVVNLIPLPTNEVIVTATGEKNENAANNEVYIVNYLVGGKEYAVQPPTEGKWFWKGNAYMWRNENDPRQPAGTTRSVTLNIPYGKDRRIQFGLSQWNGIVEVTCGDDTNRYDLFKTSEKSSLYVPVPDTEAVPLYGIKLLRLALYTAMILLLSAYPALCAIRYSDGQIATFWGRHWDKLVYIALAAGCFAVMFETGKGDSLWLDEVWTLGWVYDGNPSYAYKCFQWLYDIWFYLMPYGQEYLLIISELLVAMSVFIFGLIGSVYKSKRLGLIMATLSATSPVILAQCGGEFRPYALLLFAVTMALYLFIKKQKELNTTKTFDLLLYSGILVLCMDSHQFGLATAGLMMLFDFYLIIKRKVNANYIIEFILPALYGIYWISTEFINNLALANNYTIANSPTLKDIVNCLIWWCGSNTAYIQFAMLIVGVSIVTINIILRIYKHVFDISNDYIQLVVISIPALLLAFNIFYSTVINPQNPLWVPRYLLPVAVFFEFLIGTAIDTLIEWIFEPKQTYSNIKYNSAIITFSLILLLCIINWSKMPYEVNIKNDYKGAAEYLMAENDIYCPSTLCYVANNPYVNIGFEYYLTQKGKKDSINHISNMRDFSNEDFLPYQTIYVVSYKNRFNCAGLLEENGYTEEYNNNNKSLNVRKWVRSK